MTGHDDRTAANADRHARASHRHRTPIGRRAGVPRARLRPVRSVSAPSFRSSTERSCANKAKRATWSTLDGSCGLPG